MTIPELKHLESLTDFAFFGDLMGYTEVIAYILPFAHGVDLLRDVMAGNYQDIWLNLFVVLIYIAFISVFAIYIFRKRMKK